jgi:hypothetical protein
MFARMDYIGRRTDPWRSVTGHPFFFTGRTHSLEKRMQLAIPGTNTIGCLALLIMLGASWQVHAQ